MTVSTNFLTSSSLSVRVCRRQRSRRRANPLSGKPRRAAEILLQGRRMSFLTTRGLIWLFLAILGVTLALASTSTLFYEGRPERRPSPSVSAILADDGSESLDYWPQWRGPLGTGVAPRANPPLEWSEDKNIRWKLALPGRGHSTPVVWGDRIFLTAAISSGGQVPPPAAAAPVRTTVSRWCVANHSPCLPSTAATARSFGKGRFVNSYQMKAFTTREASRPTPRLSTVSGCSPFSVPTAFTASIGTVSCTARAVRRLSTTIPCSSTGTTKARRLSSPSTREPARSAGRSSVTSPRRRFGGIWERFFTSWRSRRCFRHQVLVAAA